MSSITKARNGGRGAQQQQQHPAKSNPKPTTRVDANNALKKAPNLYNDFIQATGNMRGVLVEAEHAGDGKRDLLEIQYEQFHKQLGDALFKLRGVNKVLYLFMQTNRSCSYGHHDSDTHETDALINEDMYGTFESIAARFKTMGHTLPNTEDARLAAIASNHSMFMAMDGLARRCYAFNHDGTLCAFYSLMAIDKIHRSRVNEVQAAAAAAAAAAVVAEHEYASSSSSVAVASATLVLRE